MPKERHEFNPAIVAITERYPEEAIYIASSIAQDFSVSQMTDILENDRLREEITGVIASKRKHFSHAVEKGFEVGKKDTRLELARVAFQYLESIRTLWMPVRKR